MNNCTYYLLVEQVYFKVFHFLGKFNILFFPAVVFVLKCFHLPQYKPKTFYVSYLTAVVVTGANDLYFLQYIPSIILFGPPFTHQTFE